MTFKEKWEKADQRVRIEKPLIEAMLARALPGRKLALHEIISGGCANLNIKIEFEKGEPFILRIYLRDKEAAFREQRLAALVRQTVPVPDICFVGDVENYRFALAEYKKGITLRDLLMSEKGMECMEGIMTEAGRTLAVIQRCQFSHSGFFNKDLCVKSYQEDWASFVRACLKHPTVLEQLPQESLSKIEAYLNPDSLLFVDQGLSRLVHGDYDPANILVHQVKGKWTISAVLDWEFAFSGSALWDVATMLRYAHCMPPVFEASFLDGLKQGGVELSENWRRKICLLNLSALLDCLTRCSSQSSPHQCADSRELIAYLLKKVEE